MSSGQPINNESQANKYMNEWLETIRLEARQNQQNLEANRVYLQSGQLPPTAELADTRSIEEKLLDIEGLKQSIINEMKTVAEPFFAAQLVNGVINSPLNIDNKLFRFFANNVSSFVETLRKRYGVGIRGDNNDVKVMVDFINSLYAETAGTLQSVSDYAKSTTNNTNISPNVLSVNDLNAILLNLRDIVKRFTVLKVRNNSVNLLNNIIERVQMIRDVIPSQATLNNLIASINGRNPFEGDVLNELFKLLEQLPKPNIVFTQIDILSKAIDNKNQRVVTNAIEKIKDLFSIIMSEDFLRLIIDVGTIPRIVDDTATEPRGRPLARTGLSPGEIADIDASIDNLNEDQINEALDELYNKGYITYEENEYVLGVDDVEEKRQYLKNEYIPNVGTNGRIRLGVYGLGIKKPKRRIGRPKGSGLATYKPLGEVEINMDKLGKGISTIRRKTKANYPDIPSKRISNNLKGIINTIVGGGMPKFNELNALDQDEKEYLHKLIKKSNLEDRLSVPAPSKDQQEKDIHQFEVMKGQLMSGNDNKEMVKKFKALMLKLVKQGLLPRNEVSELMEDLNTLGY